MISEFNAAGQPVIQLSQADYENCLKITDLIIIEGKELEFQNTKYKMHPDMSYAITFCGVLGEQAVANYFDYNYNYTPYDAYRADVLGYQVRATYYGDGHLLTHPVKTAANPGGDNPGRYISLTIEQNKLKVTIRGYSTLARCNERSDNWRTEFNGKALRYPCFFMPQNQLWPIDMLPATDELIAHQTGKAA